MQRAVIATGGEWPAGLALLRGVRAAGHPPIAALSQAGSLARWSRAPVAKLLVPDASDAEAHARALARIAGERPGAVVLPGSEASLLALAEHREVFPTPTVLGVPSVERVRAAMDKRALPELARHAGLRSPSTVELSAGDGDWAAFPAVVKPYSSEVGGDRGGRHRVLVRVVHDAPSLRAALAGLPGGRGLVQAFVEGPLRTVNGVAWEGRVACSVHKRSERTWPAGAGVLSYGRTIDVDPVLDAACARLIASLGWSGLFNLQFLEPAAGDPLLIDVNPRAYHSMALAIAAGANLPGLWLDLLLDRPPRAARARVGVRFRAEDDDLRTLKSMAVAGDRMAAARGLIPRRGTAHALFSRSDPGPWGYGMAQLVAGRAARHAGAAVSGT